MAEREGEDMLAITLELWKLAWPAMLRNFLNCACDRITLALVGHYDYKNRAHFDGAGLGKMFSNITGLSVGLGFSNGVSTLCSQAYGSGNHRQENAVHLRRCFLVFAVVFIYTAVSTIFCEDFLIAASQPADVAHSSALYARVQLFGVPFFWAAAALQSVTDSMQNTKPGLYSSALSSAVTMFLSIIAVHPAFGLKWGYLGMAAARSAGGVVQFGFLIGFVYYYKLEDVIWRIHPGRCNCVRGSVNGGWQHSPW
jgi:MATE family multidrug resistance protein